MRVVNVWDLEDKEVLWNIQRQINGDYLIEIQGDKGF